MIGLIIIIISICSRKTLKLIMALFLIILSGGVNNSNELTSEEIQKQIDNSVFYPVGNEWIISYYHRYNLTFKYIDNEINKLVFDIYCTNDLADDGKELKMNIINNQNLIDDFHVTKLDANGDVSAEKIEKGFSLFCSEEDYHIELLLNRNMEKREVAIAFSTPFNYDFNRHIGEAKILIL